MKLNVYLFINELVILLMHLYHILIDNLLMLQTYLVYF